MCVGFWSLQHPDYALILCTNRDEYLNRPTRDAAFHSFEHDIDGDSQDGRVLSGRDIFAGGTWMGITRTGRIALLTNIAEQPPAGPISSRGQLVSSFLLSDSSQPLEEEVGIIFPRNTRFAGFNLLLLVPSRNGGPDSLGFNACFVTNGAARGSILARTLSEAERRCGGISNGTDSQGSAEWPKVKQGKNLLDELLRRDLLEAELVDSLFDILAWRPAETPLDLRDTIQVEPVPIKLNGETDDGVPRFYATRLSSVLLIGRDGRVLFIERDIWKLDGDHNVFRADPQSQRVFRFTIQRQT